MKKKKKFLNIGARIVPVPLGHRGPRLLRLCGGGPGIVVIKLISGENE
jgi:hypothetical protein